MQRFFYLLLFFVSFLSRAQAVRFDFSCPDFLTQHQGSYRFDQNDYHFIVTFTPSDYLIFRQDNAYRDSDCYNFFSRVSDSQHFTLLSHTPNHYAYRITYSDGSYRNQVFTKTPTGLERRRRFFSPEGVEDPLRAELQVGVATTISPTVCDFDAPYREAYGLTLASTPEDYHRVFLAQAATHSVTLEREPVSIRILTDQAFNSPFAARAYYCVNFIRVEIRGSWWASASVAQRMAVMVHEFGHAYFDYAHVCNAQDIMFTSAHSHLTQCGASLSPVTHELNDPFRIVGFRYALRRFFAGTDQRYHSCSGKGTPFIED